MSLLLWEVRDYEMGSCWLLWLKMGVCWLILKKVNLLFLNLFHFYFNLLSSISFISIQTRKHNLKIILSITIPPCLCFYKHWVQDLWGQILSFPDLANTFDQPSFWCIHLNRLRLAVAAYSQLLWEFCSIS